MQLVEAGTTDLRRRAKAGHRQRCNLDGECGTALAAVHPLVPLLLLLFAQHRSPQSLMDVDCTEWQKKCDLPTATVDKTRVQLAVAEWAKEFELGWAQMAADHDVATTLKVFVWPEWRFRAGVGKTPLSVAEAKAITDGIGVHLSAPKYQKNVVVLPGSIYYGDVPTPKPGGGGIPALTPADVLHSSCAAWPHPDTTRWDATEFAKHAMLNCVPRYDNGALVGTHCKANEYENRAKASETWGRCLIENDVNLNAKVDHLPGKAAFAPVKTTASERDYSVDVCMDHAPGWGISSALKLQGGTKLDFLALIANGMGVNCCDGKGCDNLPLKNGGFVVRCDGKGEPQGASLFQIDTAKACIANSCSWWKKALELPLKIYSSDDTFKYQGKTWGCISSDDAYASDRAAGVFDFMVTNQVPWVMVSGAHPLPA